MEELLAHTRQANGNCFIMHAHNISNYYTPPFPQKTNYYTKHDKATQKIVYSWSRVKSGVANKIMCISKIHNVLMLNASRVQACSLGGEGFNGFWMNPPHPCNLVKFIFNETAAVQVTIIQPCSCGIVATLQSTHHVKELAVCKNDITRHS